MYESRYNLILDTPDEDMKVILNPLSGAVDIVDHKAIQFINQMGTSENIQAEEMDGEILKTCLEKGYLFHDQAEETEKLRKTVEKWHGMMRSHATHFMIYVTFACNLRCPYCVQRETNQDKSHAMSKEIVKSLFKAVDTIDQERGTGKSPRLILFGGEPLLKRKKQVEAVEEILRNCSENDYRVDVITNGVELSFYCDMLSKYNVETIQVTLDGPKEIHDKRRIFADGRGTFDKIVKGIDEVLDENIHVRIRVNVDEQNVDNLPELARFITEKGWLEKGAKVGCCGASEGIEECFNEPHCEIYQRAFDLQTTYPETKMMLFSLRLSHIFQKILDCGELPFPQAQFCWSTTGVLYSLDLYGNIFPCCCMNACCNLEELRYGMFHPELKLNRDMLEQWQRRNVFNLLQCRNCKMALFCGGGCTRTAMHQGKSLQDGVVCPAAITEKELQVAFNHYYPQLKEKAGI